MGRDNKQGQSNNKGSLPQTPKNQKMSPQKAKEEFSKELTALEKIVAKNLTEK